jgi:hypothetical protein
VESWDDALCICAQWVPSSFVLDPLTHLKRRSRVVFGVKMFEMMMITLYETTK